MLPPAQLLPSEDKGLEQVAEGRFRPESGPYYHLFEGPGDEVWLLDQGLSGFHVERAVDVWQALNTAVDAASLATLPLSVLMDLGSGRRVE